MPRENAMLFAFNRGIVSKRALARVDQERLRLSAEEMDNWIPRAVGSMSIRPGTQYALTSKSSAKAIGIPFIYSNTDTAFVECTDGYIRPIVDDAPITRNVVSTLVTNGDFGAAGSWTTASVGGGSASISGGKLTFSCVAIQSSATCTQAVNVSTSYVDVEHGLTIVVDRGPVIFRAGTTSGGSNIFATTTLDAGTHSLALTPTGTTLYLQLESRVAYNTIVDSIQFESGTPVEIASPWDIDELPNIRWAQSADILFVDCSGNKPRKIERRTTRSWSLVFYDHKDGPFDAINPNTLKTKLSVAAARGNTTLTSSKPLFKQADEGTLFRFFSAGYNFSSDMAQEDISTPAIRINGVGLSRTVSYSVSGVFVATLTLQKSFIGADSGFVDVTTASGAVSSTTTDTSDNTAVWYRWTIKTGNYTSGTATVNLTFGTGGGGGFLGGSSTTSIGGAYGICRVLTYNSATSCDVEILSEFTSNVPSDIFQYGTWNQTRGYPSAPTFHEGRLFHGGAEHVIGSVSDSYYTFDPATVGDSGPIHRSIGYGPVQVINFMLPLTRLVIGGQSSEIAVRSSSFDEPLTPTNFSLKDISTYGSTTIAAVKVDTRGIFVDKSKMKVIELAYNVQIQDFGATDLTQLVPDLNIQNQIKRMFVQRRPDTRVHCIRDDGTVAILITEPSEQVSCWVTFSTDGFVEDGFCLPDDYEDAVYYLVRRTINGTTVRYWERWAKEYECLGETLSKNIDCHYVYDGATVATISGLDHLEGETVVAWGAGKYLGSDTVSGGSITLTEAVSSAVIGLGYTADFKSAKLAYAGRFGSAVSQLKRIARASLLLYKTHWQGVKHGRDFDHIQNLPAVIRGKAIAANTIHDTLDVQMFDHPGEWDADTRIVLRATAPYPCTIMGIVMDITTNDN